MALAVSVAVGAPATIRAQGLEPSRWTGTLDGGVSQVRYEDFLTSSTVSLTPTVRWEGQRALVVASGALTRFESSNVNASGAAAGAWFVPGPGALQWELGGTASAGVHRSLGSAAAAQGQIRLHQSTAARRGAWVGVAGGLTALGGRGTGVATAEAAGWVRLDSATVQLLVRPAMVGELRYTDLEGSARWRNRAVEAAVRAGWRWGDATAFTSGWLSADVAFWMHQRFALLVGAGRFAADPAAGTIGGNYASVAVRVATRAPVLPLLRMPRRGAAPPAPARGRAARAGSTGSAIGPAAGVEVVAVDGDQRRLRLRVPEAGRVEVMGDFTEWSPMALRRVAEGLWEVTVPLAAGVHRVNVRVDGGEWRVPTGLAAVDDDFEGKVGLLVVQ